MRELRAALQLYLVADPEHCNGDVVSAVTAAIAGGVTMVQLRAKRLSDSRYLELARQVQRACSAQDVAFIVNDRIDIALAAGANGVHLGVDDLPIEAARSIGGPGFLIGYSPETIRDLESAAARGADYLGIGPVFGTATKVDAGSALGLDEFAARVRIGGLPVVGIGGINAGNARSVLAAGADGVAVVSAILGSADPEGAARQLSRNS